MDVLYGTADPEAWQIRTNPYDQGMGKMPPATIDGTARIHNSLVSPGCVISGEVSDSVLSPGVHIEKGARVANSLIFHNTVIHSGADVHNAIVDKKSIVDSDTRIGEPLAGAALPADGDLVILGKNVVVDRGARIAPGASVPAGQRVAAETADP
jgi:glucose-1-phosphate adenylyltransferase